MYDVLLKTREAIQKLKRDYNEEVLNLRDRKMKMIERHEFLRETLLEISKEIPAENKRDPPELPTYDEDIEFPEKKLMWTEKGVFEELPKRYQKLYKTEIAKKKEIKMLDKEYEMLILEKRGQKLGKIYSKLNLMKYSGIATSGDIKELEETGKDDQVSTPWEKECRKLRLIKRLYQQDGIIDEMETAIREFDEDIFRLHESKLRIEVDIKFLELYLLTVHQEVLILKKFEAAEEEKENNLFEKLTEKHEIQKKMNEINNRVEARNREIRRCEEEIKNLVTTYHAAIADNKFFDFLRRIFKKKYRPPKVKSEDSESESESESESSSEEDETKSLDSKDIGPIRLDENVCPPGCDTQLYEWTFKQRSARHELELTIIEEKRHVELHKKDYESLMKKIKFVESQYLICKRDLEEFMREKQRNLNEIQTIVILRLSQIQNFKKDHEMEKIKDSVIFSAQGLSNLYKRVGELEKETELQKQKHAKNQQHLQRMKIDIKHMREVIIRLNNEINEVMLRKFGVKIDIDDLEESLLKRMVAEMHGIVLDLERQLDKNLKSIRDTLIEKKETYSRKMQENTERYNLLTVLQEEKTKLQQLLLRQEKVLCAEPIISEKEQQNDIEKLTKVAKLQEERIATLKLEIKMLKYKVKPTTPAPGMYSSEALGSKQRIIIRGCDGEIEEITAETRDELKDIYEETQEIVQDLREGDINEEDVERLRKLTGEFIERLPSKCQAGVVSRLSMRSIVDEEDAKQLAEGIIMDIVRNIRTESFLETTEMMADMVESIMPQFDDDEDNKK